ncbi:EthD domain-containing protein [Roseixanthobacter pseudopolyaromaticivorans]|uniref:EthD domain-containing protein n=1 Tax=Xanthobacter sp. VTT E-85239 TaxID=3119919 RepID=UPI0037356D06
MIKHIRLINGHPNQTFDEFRGYWINAHSELVKGVLLGLHKYVANFPARLGEPSPRGAADI